MRSPLGGVGCELLPPLSPARFREPSPVRICVIARFFCGAQAHGSELAASVLAATAALVHAGVPMRDLVTCCSLVRPLLLAFPPHRGLVLHPSFFMFPPLMQHAFPLVCELPTGPP